jgi:hypothetical protein
VAVGVPDEAWHLVDRRMALAQQRDDLVGRVRSIDGFEDFLRAPRLASLLPAASGGPVVVVNVSTVRCDALIVRETGVSVLALPGLAAADVELSPSGRRTGGGHPGRGHDRPPGVGGSRLWTVRRRGGGLRTSLPGTAL